MRNPPNQAKNQKLDFMRSEAIKSLLPILEEAGVTATKKREIQDQINSCSSLTALENKVSTIYTFYKNLENEKNQRAKVGNDTRVVQFSEDGASGQSNWIEDKKVILEKLNRSMDSIHKSTKLKQDKINLRETYINFLKGEKKIDKAELANKYREAISIDSQANEIKRLIILCDSKNESDFKKNFPNTKEHIEFLNNLILEKASEIDTNEKELATLKISLNRQLEVEIKAKLKAEDEEKAKAEAEARVKVKLEARAKRKAEEQAKLEAEARAKREAEARAKSKAEEKAKLEAEEKAKLEAKARAKLEAEEKAKAEAEARAKLEAEEKAQKAFARQQRRAEYLEKINLEKMDGIISEAISKIEDGIVNELASKFVAEEVSRLEEEDRIKSKTVADAVDRIENKIIDELLPEFVNKVVDELLPEFVNKVVDELVTEYLNEALAEIVVEALAEVKAEEKTKIEAEERSRLKDQIRAEIESEVRAEMESKIRAEIELRVREELEVAHKNEITKLKARFDSDIRVLNEGFIKEMETAQNEFEDKAGARMAERDRDRERDRNIDRDRIKLLLSGKEEELKKLEDVHKINLERKLKELKNAHKIDLEKKLKELETSLRDEYKELLNKKILEEQKKHSKELEEIFAQLTYKRGVGEITPENFPPLAQDPLATQTPRLSLASKKKTDEDIISHESIFEIIANADITSREKIKKLNIVKANTSPEHWEYLLNKKKEKSTPLQFAILSDDSILAEYFILNNTKINESNICSAIYFLTLSEELKNKDKLKILTQILNSASNNFSEEHLREILNKKSTADYTLLDYASICDESFVLKLTDKGARFKDCKQLHVFLYYAFNSSNFEQFVANAEKNGEKNIFGTITSDCQNLFHHLSNSYFNLTSAQIKEKLDKLNLRMDRSQFLISINQEDKDGFSPLDLAIQKDNIEFALELVEKGANKNHILHKFYYYKKYEMMEVFYQKGLIKFSEFPDENIENLRAQIHKNQNHFEKNFNDEFLKFIDNKIKEENLGKNGLGSGGDSSQPNQASEIRNSALLSQNSAKNQLI